MLFSSVLFGSVDALAVRLADKPEDGTEATAEARRKLIAGFWGTRGANGIKLTADMDAPKALGVIAAECLEQVIHNAAMLAEVDTAGVYQAGHSEHVHQLRVGVRRLRSAWRLFDGWTAPIPDALLDGVRRGELDRLPMPPGVDMARWMRAFPSFGFLLSVHLSDAKEVCARFADRGIAAAVIGRATAGSSVDLVLGAERATFWDWQQRPYLGLGRQVAHA